MTDPLASWWVHTVGVHRLSGSGAGGDVFTPPLDADPDTITGFWSDGNKLVRDQNGEEVVSSAQFGHPLFDPDGQPIASVPPGSVLIAPPEFGSRSTTVIATARGDGGGNPTPDHYELMLR